MTVAHVVVFCKAPCFQPLIIFFWLPIDLKMAWCVSASKQYPALWILYSKSCLWSHLRSTTEHDTFLDKCQLDSTKMSEVWNHHPMTCCWGYIKRKNNYNNKEEEEEEGKENIIFIPSPFPHTWQFSMKSIAKLSHDNGQITCGHRK